VPTPPRLTLVTRGSPLARRQTELTVERLARLLPGTEFVTEIIVTTGDRRTEWSLEKLLKRVPKVQCSDAESLRQKDRVKKDTEEKQPRNKKSGAQKRKNSGSAVFCCIFNQSHVLQEKFRRRWYFFSQNGADV
jgi:hypothetical protein